MSWAHCLWLWPTGNRHTLLDVLLVNLCSVHSMVSGPPLWHCRGHRVMTVAPRYAAYGDAADTGVDALLELPCSLQPVQHRDSSGPDSPDRAASNGTLHTSSIAAAPAPSSLGQLTPPPAECADFSGVLAAGSRPGSDTGLASQAAAAAGVAAAADLLRPSARLFLCRRGGVDRVFVDHPLYEAADDIYGPSGADTYLEVRVQLGSVLP